MIDRIVRRVVRMALKNTGLRTLIEQEMAYTHPLLSSPQLAFAPPGHFYSPLPDIGLIYREEERLYSTTPTFDGVELNGESQLRLLETMIPLVAEYDWSETQVPERRYWIKNQFFEEGDGLSLFLMMKRFRPKRIVEVGSGFSSALMLDTNERHLQSSVELTFIEPYPDRLNGLLRPDEKKTVRLLTQPVQTVPLSVFDALEENDILFIDSSHVTKLGSDVNHLLFTVLPRLRPGVLVHVHDIFYPFEYPKEWIRMGYAWNELYILRAFLQFNSTFEIVLFNNYLGKQQEQRLIQFFPLLVANPGGSIYLRRLASDKTPELTAIG